jgi:hypothetical protein
LGRTSEISSEKRIWISYGLSGMQSVWQTNGKEEGLVASRQFVLLQLHLSYPVYYSVPQPFLAFLIGGLYSFKQALSSQSTHLHNLQDG